MFIILCTITTILDRRKPPLFVDSTEIQDNQSKREQVESSASDDSQRRNKWNPQTLGNFSLVLIQGSLFSLFQIVATGASLEAWSVRLCLLVAIVGFGFFFLATTMSPAGSVITGVLLLVLTAIGIFLGLQGVATGWIIFFQIFTLLLAWLVSESLKGPNQKWFE